MLKRVLRYIRSKIDRYKFNKLIKQLAKDTDLILDQVYNKDFKYLGTNHIMVSNVIYVTCSNIKLYRDIFKQLSTYDHINPTYSIEHFNFHFNPLNISVNKFLTDHKEDPIKVLKESIYYYKLFNYKYLEIEKSEYTKYSLNYINKTRNIRYEFLNIVKKLNKLEL